ncbi:hypothetical protein V6N13_061288 [Hibiscus sabdariffa]|uniref:Uncharacterized protein n=1 Tax=Hibiscus sabdariffa TaxID=183260 RepID=A0ABR2EFS9_9ROSI
MIGLWAYSNNLPAKHVVPKVKDFELFTVNDLRWELVADTVVRNGEIFELRELPDCRRQRPIKRLGFEYKLGDFKNVGVAFGESSLAENSDGAAGIGGGEPLTGDTHVLENSGKSL